MASSECIHRRQWSTPNTHKQRLPQQLLRSRRHRIAAQQYRGRRQAGRHRRHEADQRLANVGGHRHAELEQQPLAERADQHLEQLQQSAAAAQKLHVHAREQPTAAYLDATVALLVWPEVMLLLRLAAAGHFDDGGRHVARETSAGLCGVTCDWKLATQCES